MEFFWWSLSVAVAGAAALFVLKKGGGGIKKEKFHSSERLEPLQVDSGGIAWKLDSPGAGLQRWVKCDSQEDTGKTHSELRRYYSLHREEQRHASDLIYRTSHRSRERVRAVVEQAAAMGKAKTRNVHDAVIQACLHLESIQDDDGHIPADYGGPMFLLPGFAICSLICERDIDPDKAREMRRYLQNHLNSDGGWPMHVEGESTVFGTALNYAAYRILGGSALDPFAVRARTWLKARGGALPIPSWGKMWLALLGCYEWEGMNPVPPELWLVPRWLPIHPGRLWCFARTVYLPMGYLYAMRPAPPASAMPLIRELREELFVEAYDSIDWSKARSNISPIDVYRPYTKLLALANFSMAVWERIVPKSLRKKAVQEVILAITQEDETTNYICIGPVNKMLNLVVRHLVDGKESRASKLHWEKTEDYLWVSEDGMKMQGFNGCQSWDAAFAVQAMMEFKPAAEHIAEIARPTSGLLRFLNVAQSLKNPIDMRRFYRSASIGGWGFSTSEQGWIVSDCTGEGILAVLNAHSNGYRSQITNDRLCLAADLMLEMQNGDGGWATCEETRGPKWLELLNPSEVFGDIMIDYSHVECTSSVVKALALFRKNFADHRKAEIELAIQRGVRHLIGRQRPDGSFKGFWAVCFTYGTWFAVEGLRAGGIASDHPSVARACKFLISKQNDDGGWGETHKSCSDSVWDNCESQVVQTAWAILTLLLGPSEISNSDYVKKGVRFLLRSQIADTGDWPQQRICGSFNGNCGISYINFRSYFPLWALARFHALYGNMEL